MAQKMVKVRLLRTMNPVDGGRRERGYETEIDVGLAEKWLRNGRIELMASGKEKARPAKGAADPTPAPPSGSPAGPGAVSSSSLPARQQEKKTSKPRGRPPKPKPPTVDPFG